VYGHADFFKKQLLVSRRTAIVMGRDGENHSTRIPRSTIKNTGTTTVEKFAGRLPFASRALIDRTRVHEPRPSTRPGRGPAASPRKVPPVPGQ